MATLRCPHCHSALPSQRTWAQVAVSTLMAAPAIADMATQVRCEKCGRLSAASDMRVVVADRFTLKRPIVGLTLVVILVATLVWMFLR